MGAKTKIDWADSTWNPVTGCLHECEYCYARSIAKRFGGGEAWNRGCSYTEKMHELHTAPQLPYPFYFEPTYHWYLINKPQHWRKSRNIFVCSMADLFGDWVPDQIIKEIFEACAAAPQHRYLFLTKNPERYLSLYEKGILPNLKNHWYGTTIMTAESLFWCSNIHNTFVSVEPIMGDIETLETKYPPDWVIVGAMTGPSARKYPVKREWIDGITEECKKRNIPVFMKESLRGLMGGDLVQEYPW